MISTCARSHSFGSGGRKGARGYRPVAAGTRFDPSYASAAGLFGRCRVLQWTNRVISDEDTAEGVRFAQQAIEGGTEDPDALWMGGWAIFFLGGAHAAGLSAIERALALIPIPPSRGLSVGGLGPVLTGRLRRSRRSSKRYD